MGEYCSQGNGRNGFQEIKMELTPLTELNIIVIHEEKGGVNLIAALIVFATTYILMLALPKIRHFIALGSAACFVLMGVIGIFDYTPLEALSEIDFNVLLMIGGTMGIVILFIESRFPIRMAEILITHVPKSWLPYR